MKATLLLVGPTIGEPLQTLSSDYAGRIAHYLPFNIDVVPAVRSRSLSEDQQREEEGRAILRRIGSGDHVVLLDEHGREPTSMEMAAWLGRHQHTTRQLTFVIGGPYGFAPAVRQRANETLALSRLTFSHQMVRVIFLEQLYRCCTILRGEPYHHE